MTTDNPPTCNAYTPPTGSPENSGYCDRCGMHDWKHAAPTAAGTCDASMLIPGPNDRTSAAGPCILRAGHDGPVHQDANGAKWWLTGPDTQARSVVGAVTREQLHDAIRTLARHDPKWWHDKLRTYARINHNGRLPR